MISVRVYRFIPWRMEDKRSWNRILLGLFDVFACFHVYVFTLPQIVMILSLFTTSLAILSPPPHHHLLHCLLFFPLSRPHCAFAHISSITLSLPPPTFSLIAPLLFYGLWCSGTAFVWVWLISLNIMMSWSPVPPISLQMSGFHFSFWLCTIPLFMYITFSLPIHLFMDPVNVSSVFLSRICSRH